MASRSWTTWSMRTPGAFTFSLTFVFLSTLVAFSNVFLTKQSRDPSTNSTSQHATEVESGTYSFGSTIVAAQEEGACPVSCPPGYVFALSWSVYVLLC